MRGSMLLRWLPCRIPVLLVPLALLAGCSDSAELAAPSTQTATEDGLSMTGEGDTSTDSSGEAPSLQKAARAGSSVGAVACFGGGTTGINTPSSAALAGAKSISTMPTGAYACAITSNNRISCWGTGAPSLSTYTWLQTASVSGLAAGTTASCVVLGTATSGPCLANRAVDKVHASKA